MKNLKNKFDFLEKKVGKRPPFSVLPTFYRERLKGRFWIDREVVAKEFGEISLGVKGEPLILDLEIGLDREAIGILETLTIWGSRIEFKTGFSLHAPKTTVLVVANSCLMEEGLHFGVEGLLFSGTMEKFPDNFSIGVLKLPKGLKELPKNLNVEDQLLIPGDFENSIEGLDPLKWKSLTEKEKERVVRRELEEKRNGFIGDIYFV